MSSQEREVTKPERAPYRVDVGDHRTCEARNPDTTGYIRGE
jgi:hypothetical protein